MRVLGSVPASRVAALAELTRSHTTTEHVFRFVDAGDLPYDIHAMDEYTLDLVVTLPDGVVLVYDTT